uniref:Probable G-protein coupled receptor 33 n=1 Tax=Pelodiscus sinensis TaxID=13735 RepID=K7FD37_PELSI
MASAGLLFPTVLVGLVGNGLYLWVLGWKMKRTVTTLWFLHLVSCSLLFTLLIPFFIIYILMGFHWVLGMAMCKLISACIQLGMFSSVFLLTLISLDRYTLTCHPVWSQHHRTMHEAKKLVAGVWLVSLALSVPYLAFQETSMLGDGRVACTNYYTGTGDQAGDAWKEHILSRLVSPSLAGSRISFILSLSVQTPDHLWVILWSIGPRGFQLSSCGKDPTSLSLCWSPSVADRVHMGAPCITPRLRPKGIKMLPFPEPVQSPVPTKDVQLASAGLLFPTVLETSMLGDGRVACTNYYTGTGDQAGDAWKEHMYLVLFMSRLLLGFLLPLCVIAGCYVRMGLTMKEKGLARSGKPFKVMVAAVVSFVFGWLPYHLYYGLMLFIEGPKSLTATFQLICVIMFCANVCFTPVLYLFVGQTFQQVFRASLISLVRAAFYEDLDSDGLGPHSHGRTQRETDCM